MSVNRNVTVPDGRSPTATESHSLPQPAPLTAEEKTEAAEKLRAVLDDLEEPRALDARLEHAADLLELE
jgi:hypothetical protein